jgi:hypothetical protein
MKSDSGGFEKFTDQIKTKEQLFSLLDEIEEAKRRAYKYKQTTTLSAKLGQAVPETFRRNIAELENQGILTKSATSQNAFLVALKKSLSGKGLLRLTLAFTPRAEFIDKLSEWTEKTTGQKVILDIFVQEEVIGGALFEYEGEYRDYSLAKKLDKVLEENDFKYI